MSFFLDNVSDLEDEQLNLAISGPSMSSKKSKPDKQLWNLNSIEFKSNLDNTKLNNNIGIKNDRQEKLDNIQSKLKGGIQKVKTSGTANIKQLLSDRLKMYNIAANNAKKSGELKKVQKLNKDIQILNALITHHESGNIIDLKSIPPEIKINLQETKSTNPQLGVTFKESAEVALIPRSNDIDSTSSSDTDSEASIEQILSILRLRRDQYKISVVQNKSSGNVQRALEHLSIVKLFESVIKHLEMGEKVDLNELPGPPECKICHLSSDYDFNDERNLAMLDSSSLSSIEEKIISHSTILQALQERLRAYEILKIKAKRESTENASEIYRMDRIIRNYKEAITVHRARKPFPFEDLPSPPGFSPIINQKTNTKFNKFS